MEAIKESFFRKIEQKWEIEPPETIAEFKAAHPLMVLDDKKLYRSLSRIPNAGKGLFTSVAIPAGTFITWYSGARVVDMSLELTRQLKARDPHLKDYRQSILALGMYIYMLGNYKPGKSPEALPTKVDPDNLESTFQGDGAAQFMNGRSSLDNDDVNVGLLSIRSMQLHVVLPPHDPKKELLNDYKNRMRERWIDEFQRLLKEHPDEVIVVAVALRNIAAGEELITSYGHGYFEETNPVKRFPNVFRRH